MHSRRRASRGGISAGLAIAVLYLIRTGESVIVKVEGNANCCPAKSCTDVACQDAGTSKDVWPLVTHKMWAGLPSAKVKEHSFGVPPPIEHSMREADDIQPYRMLNATPAFVSVLLFGWVIQR